MPELFREFQMTIYVFDKPDSLEQVHFYNNTPQDDLIQQLGSFSNKISEIYIQMTEWEKFTVAR